MNLCAEEIERGRVASRAHRSGILTPIECPRANDPAPPRAFGGHNGESQSSEFSWSDLREVKQ